MKKNWQPLTTEHFDLAIVGGGIHGALLTLAAAQAGYRVALVEKGDFGHSTSANSLKIVHGGIRYLQHGDFKRMRESILSRRAMMRFAPHLVKPLACVMPTYGHGLKGREMMRLAFAIYDVIACDRNLGLPEKNRLPRGTAISVPEMQWVAPGIREKGLTGGAVWYDTLAENTERLVLAYVKEAVRYGAEVANYTEASEVLKGEGRVTGLALTDTATGRTGQLRCSMVVNAAGPWLDRLDDGSTGGAQLWATAVNIVVKKKLFKKYAVGLEGYTDYTDKDAIIKRGKRLFFFVPWRKEYTMIGTSYTPYRGGADNFALQQKDIRLLLDEINMIYPAAGLSMADVTFFHGGLLPMNEADTSQADTVQLEKSSRIIDHGKAGGVKGLVSIKGVKYTTAPDIADKVVMLVQSEKHLGPRAAGSYTAIPPRRLDFTPIVKLLGESCVEIQEYLKDRYGSEWREVFGYLGREDCMKDGRADWLSINPPLLAAEMLYFIREEMASTLADVVFRRSDLATAECPAAHTLSTIADRMAQEMGWTEEERRYQLESVVDVFTPLREEPRLPNV